MPHKTFFWFFFPTGLAMILFIGLPIVSSFFQSLHIENQQILMEVENCDPFGCTTNVRVDVEATEKLKEQNPLGRFNGFGTYTDRNHLAFDEIGEAWNTSSSINEFKDIVLNLPFYKAMLFTLTFCFAVTPPVIFLGFIVALSINTLAKSLKGLAIFGSILPMIVTPLIGSLVLFWMIDSQGIIGATIKILFSDPNLSLKSSSTLTWITLIIYGIWHNTPFAFIVFYAALQTVPQDPIEAALIDGASRFQRVRYIVIPHLYPVATIIILICLMDNFRVFEPIIGFSAEGVAQSLSWMIYQDLRNENKMLFGSAGATSMLTIIGIAILLTPVLLRTWREFRTER
jgi:multiple sugar transport system permease protein